MLEKKRTDRPADRLIFTDLKVFLRIVRFKLENKMPLKILSVKARTKQYVCNLNAKVFYDWLKNY